MHPEWMVAVRCAMLLLSRHLPLEKDPAKIENGVGWEGDILWVQTLYYRAVLGS